MPDGVRVQLAEAVRSRGLSLLDAWLGPEEVKLEILSVLAAGRNLLLEGPVGSGKTLLGESIAGALGPIHVAGCWFNCLPGQPVCPQCRAGLTPPGEVQLSGAERFVRIQGSPDLYPEDLVGDVDPAAALTHGVLDPRTFAPAVRSTSERWRWLGGCGPTPTSRPDPASEPAWPSPTSPLTGGSWSAPTTFSRRRWSPCRTG